MRRNETTREVIARLKEKLDAINNRRPVAGAKLTTKKRKPTKNIAKQCTPRRTGTLYDR